MGSERSREGAAIGTTSSGVAKVKAVASASGSSDRAMKLANMPPEPASDRPTWPSLRRVESACGNSPRRASQTTSVAMANTERNSTTSPTGNRTETVLMIADIAAKAKVAAILRMIPSSIGWVQNAPGNAPPSIRMFWPVT